MKAIILASAMLAAASITALGQTQPVEISNAWARATPGKAENGAAYVTVRSNTADRLTGVETPVAARAELHEMKMDNGIMKMRQVTGVDLPAGQAVALKPGGEHIMLFGLKQPLRAGESFPLTLDFEKAGKQQVTVKVEAAGAMGMDHNGPGGMSMPMNR